MSTIYVRISLLTVSTMMFGLIWSNDHKPVVKQKTVVTYDFTQPCPMKTLEPVWEEITWEQTSQEMPSWALAVVPETEPTPTEDLPAETLIEPEITVAWDVLVAEKPVSLQVETVSFPLPRQLTSGQYRVIDRFGQVENLTVGIEELRSWGLSENNPPQNSYEVVSGEDRWHLIRIEAKPVSEPTQEQLVSAWNTVFQFAGETLQPTMSHISSPVENWLESPAAEISAETKELN